MMMDWNEYQKQIGKMLGELMKLSPDTVRGYQALSAANSAASKLGEKTPKFIIESDASIVAPLIFAYVLGW